MSHGGSSTVQYSIHLHINNAKNNTVKQNTQNRTYVTIRIHKRNNKNTQFTKLNRSMQTYSHIYTYNDIKWEPRFGPFHAVNTLLLGYKNQSVNVV